MTTGRIILPALSFVPLDGSAGNLPPSLDFVQSSGGPSGPRYPRWTFTNTQYRWLCTIFRLPADYVGNMVWLFDWYAAATTGNCYWVAFVAAITESGAATIEDKGAAAEAAAIDTPDGTTKELSQKSVSLNEDGAVAGDLVAVIFGRKASHGSDTMTGDAFFLGGILEYNSSG